MFRVHLIALFVTGFLATLSSAADDTYTLKLYKVKKGDKIDHEKTKESKHTYIYNTEGLENKEEIVNEVKDVYTDEILECAINIPTKLIRTYSTAEESEKGVTTKAAYAGEPILIETKRFKYEFSIKGKLLNEDDAPTLFTQINSSTDYPRYHALLPQNAIKVGDSWKVHADISQLMVKSARSGTLRFDAKKSSIGGKLTKAYKKDGAQFAIIDVTIEWIVTEAKTGLIFRKTKEGSKMVSNYVIDACIDGSVLDENVKSNTTIDVTGDLINFGSFAIRSKVTSTEKAAVST